jgi:hypothetical protein
MHRVKTCEFNIDIESYTVNYWYLISNSKMRGNYSIALKH